MFILKLRGIEHKIRRNKMSRKPIIAGNWKMNLLQAQAKELFMGIAKYAENYKVEELPTIIIAPTFLSVGAVEGMRCDKCRPLVKIGRAHV